MWYIFGQKQKTNKTNKNKNQKTRSIVILVFIFLLFLTFKCQVVLISDAKYFLFFFCYLRSLLGELVQKKKSVIELKKFSKSKYGILPTTTNTNKTR